MAKVGRPRIIGSPEELDHLVEEYCSCCRERDEPITLTGMILHVGLSSRESFDEYGRRPEFSDSAKRAKLLIEAAYERRLDGGKPTGAIFALKNMGWTDRVDVEHRGALANIDLRMLPDHLIARLAAGENPMSVLASAAQHGYDALRLGDGDTEGEVQHDDDDFVVREL